MRAPSLLLSSLALCAACGGSDGGARGAPVPYARPAYAALSETGLYADFEQRVLASGVATYAPAFALWSDGAAKERWIQLPPGAQIDSADMDRWVLPVGSRVWKQFSLGGVALETRLIERYGTGREDYWMGSFVWDATHSDAFFVEEGQRDVLATPHDAPSEAQCWSCHNGEVGRVIGVSALQLSGASPGLTLEDLIHQDRLSAPPAPGTTYAPPGDALTSAALGYLHANCGHCHNSRGTAWPDTQMVLRLNAGELAAPPGAGAAPPEETALYRSIVGQAVQYFRDEDLPVRVVPQAPEQSALVARMQVRGPRQQMPPLGTESLDPEGLDRVTRWIAGLSAPGTGE